MRKVLLALGLVLLTAVAALILMASRYEAKSRNQVRLGDMQLGGLTRTALDRAVSTWWNREKAKTIALRLPDGKQVNRTIEALGVGLDVEATIAQVPFEDFWKAASGKWRQEPQPLTVEPVYRQQPADWKWLKSMLPKPDLQRVPPRVLYREGNFVRSPERVGQTLDEAVLSDLAYRSALARTSFDVPMRSAPKKVSDDVLEAIDEIRKEYTTTFSAAKVSRSSNIRLAASKIDGLVLAPGERFSFNKVVGRRTAKAGFQEAGVYLNGRHEVDLGGGICQVSTTLYNAVLFANLKIVQRQNHSMPVPYVPLGRDATVDYGNVDFVFENSLETPIAISATTGKNWITFRVLGKADPSMEVKIESFGAKSWDLPQKTVPDPTLPEGRRKVIEKGSRGHSISTTRVVYRDGVEVARHPLGQSYYRGGVRIIAVGTRPAATDPTRTDAIPETAEDPQSE